ncbi:MAG: Septum formation protein Maf [Pelotomaculum sp. PtaB.Bin104]|nr:MAG: Septum formation protein Maf [Pelotomaculum sp. PtaB.Bin104]
MKELILASASPRRSQLLKQLGLDYRVMICNQEENTPPGLKPAEVVELLAERKAMAVAEVLNDGIVIGADTVVVWQGQVLGKPSGDQEAEEMLNGLQGGAHDVYTGVAVVDAGSRKIEVGHEITRVIFRPVGMDEIRRYVASGEPLDKAGPCVSPVGQDSAYPADGLSNEDNASPKGTGCAGAYAIQGIGAIFVERIEGDYTNVVGLPLPLLYQMLNKMDYNIFDKQSEQAN